MLLLGAAVPLARNGRSSRSDGSRMMSSRGSAGGWGRWRSVMTHLLGWYRNTGPEACSTQDTRYTRNTGDRYSALGGLLADGEMGLHRSICYTQNSPQRLLVHGYGLAK